jgi:hypothetical protein
MFLGGGDIWADVPYLGNKIPEAGRAFSQLYVHASQEHHRILQNRNPDASFKSSILLAVHSPLGQVKLPHFPPFTVTVLITWLGVLVMKWQVRQPGLARPLLHLVRPFLFALHRMLWRFFPLVKVGLGMLGNIDCCL